MTLSAGIDVGSGVVKAVVMSFDGDRRELLAHVAGRIRKRDVSVVVDEVFQTAVDQANVDSLDYVGTTGEGEDVPFATGHFYGMTTHARGGLHLDPRATAVLDVGALHSRAVLMNEQGKVLDHKMTSQCASGSGQFLENIARYLRVSHAAIGELSRAADDPNILRGIHDSMAGRFVRLLRSIGAHGVVLMTGGLANDAGLLESLRDALGANEQTRSIEVAGHPLSIHAGAIGAAIWGEYRYQKLKLGGAAWTASKNGRKLPSES